MKHTDELKSRVVEFVLDAPADLEAANGTKAHMARELGLSEERLRDCVRVGR